MYVVPCMHPIVDLNAEFGVLLSLIMFVENARGTYMDEAYVLAG